MSPTRETMKEIIEADTDDMKEVLCLGATFAPTQQFMLSNLDVRRETMKKIIEADNDPMKEVLRPCYALGQHLLPLNNLCCQICSGRETMKKIIEADTDPMKEVLRLRPTFHAAFFDHFI